jgi:hypothetical protein
MNPFRDQSCEINQLILMDPLRDGVPDAIEVKVSPKRACYDSFFVRSLD